MSDRRLRRSESFLGIHFDFHAREDCNEVGKNVTPEMVERIIDLVGPDYIQCDCKGHPGFASYPTKVGTPVPGFVRDQLGIWREVTARRGVALYMHYSGVMDQEAVRRHPEWAAIDADGKGNARNASLFGPYVDELLIPQLQELSDRYHVDGVWVDGDCWATKQDYCTEAIAEFRKRTGAGDIPRKPGDPHFFEYTEMCRQAFRDYVAHYVDAMHKHNSSFQVASNWAYSSQMPEPAAIDVDFISGDYSLQDSVNSARFEGRCMQRQGKPWDLMAWSFSGRQMEPDRSTKSVVQLQQEAAVVLALGGGFQAYFKQKRDGSIYPWTMNVMKEVAEFCRSREEFCHRAKPVPQIALLYAGKSFYRKNEILFGGGWANAVVRALKGILRSLLDSQNVVEICMEHHLEGRLDEYPLIIVPEWDYLEPAFRTQLADYVERGGRLLLVGAATASLFSRELDIELSGDIDGETTRWLEHGGRMCGIMSHFQTATLGQRARPFANVYREDDMVAAPGQTAAVVSEWGKGRIGAVLFGIGEPYVRGETDVLRTFLKAMVDELFPEPTVRVSGSRYADVTLMKKDDRLCVNLVNTAGPHADRNVFVFDEVPPVGPITVELRTMKKPNTVSIEPGRRPVEWSYDNGVVRLVVERVGIHDIIVVE